MADHEDGLRADEGPIRILALCGSLRSRSRCRSLLQAVQLAARDHTGAGAAQVHLFEGLGALPFFNPDLEAQAPAAVQALWQAVTQADAILIASPEYAHGVTGVIKNTLDWLVGHMPFAGKPVAVLNPSHRAEHADAALKETLTTMAARLVPGGCARVPVTAIELDAAGIAADPALSGLIAQVLTAVHVAVRTGDTLA